MLRNSQTATLNSPADCSLLYLALFQAVAVSSSQLNLFFSFFLENTNSLFFSFFLKRCRRSVAWTCRVCCSLSPKLGALFSSSYYNKRRRKRWKKEKEKTERRKTCWWLLAMDETFTATRRQWVVRLSNVFSSGGAQGFLSLYFESARAPISNTFKTTSRNVWLPIISPLFRLALRPNKWSFTNKQSQKHTL